MKLEGWVQLMTDARLVDSQFTLQVRWTKRRGEEGEGREKRKEISRTCLTDSALTSTLSI
jgi:hypothetical protein